MANLAKGTGSAATGQSGEQKSGAHKMQREDVETHGLWAFIEASALLPHACRWLRSEHGPGLVPSAYG